MSDFNRKVLRNLEKLSHIACSEKEEAVLTTHLIKILDYVTQMDAIDTDEVPTFSEAEILTDQNILRDDQVANLLDGESYLQNAPATTAGMIRVPPVISDDTE